MNKSISLMVLASLAFAAPVAAKDEKKSEERVIVKKHFGGGISEFDTNKDGKVSKKEFEKGSKARSKERFKDMDTDGDGYLTIDERGHRIVRHRNGSHVEIDIEGINAEVDAALAQVDEELARVEVEIQQAMKGNDNVFVFRTQGHHARRMKHMDDNKDGKVSRDEYLKSRSDQFAEIDKNNDGFVSDDEMAEYKPKHMKKRWVIKNENDKK